MTDKHLTESAWKSFAKGGDYKDSALLKALAALSKAERDGPQAVLDALDEIEKQLKTLRSAHKGDKELTGYLDKVEKAADAQRKASEKDLKEAEASEDEEEDSPVLLTSKLVPLIKLVRKGDVVMKAMIVTTGKETAVMLSKRAIAPTRSKLLKEYLGASGGAKTILGDCLLEENAITFVVQSQAAGLAKKLKLALHKQTELRLKIRVRGEDPDDLDEEGEEGEGGDADQPQAGSGTDAPQPDELQARFDARLAKLEPLIAATLRAQRGDVARIRAVADFAREKGGGGNPAAGLKALDAVEQLLRAAVDGAGTKPKADEKPDGDSQVDPATAFTARLTALMPKVKEALTAAGPNATDVKLKVSEAGMLARKREFDQAHALLDEAESLLQGGVDAGGPQADPKPDVSTPTSPTAPPTAKGANVAYTQSRLAWDQTRKKVQAELRKLEASILDICKDEPDFGEIASGTKDLFELMEVLDERLIDTLDEALNAEDPEARKELHDEAREIVAEYLEFVKENELLQEIDSNGFVDVAIHSTLTATLGVLSRRLAELG